MKIFALSDIHFENYKQEGMDNFVHGLKNDLVKMDKVPDVIVIAGDIAHIGGKLNEEKYEYGINLFCQFFNNVIIVPGNHEFWNAHKDYVFQYLDKLEEKNKNLHVLKSGKIVEVMGQRFIGDVLFYTNYKVSKELMLDFIDFRVNNARSIFAYCENTLKWMDENVKSTDIIVSHHPPLALCLNAYFAGTDSDYLFHCKEADRIIKNNCPKLWICGHTHVSFDFVENKTRVYGNPFGYHYAVNQQFKYDLIEV